LGRDTKSVARLDGEPCPSEPDEVIHVKIQMFVKRGGEECVAIMRDFVKN